MKNIASSKKLLFKNTIMLYVLIFSGYFFNLITVPYQTRILGPELYGMIGFIQAIYAYVQLVLDFGFLLSATLDVANNRGNKQALSKIMTSVMICKLLLGVICFLGVEILCSKLGRIDQYHTVYYLFFVVAFANTLLPDYLYRGMENMTSITARTVLIRLFFTICIFLFLKNKDDVCVIPLLNAIGAFGACIWSYYDLHKRLEIKFVKVSIQDVFNAMKNSSSYFFSRIATTVYSASNSLILGLIYPTGGTLGYYTSADKLMSTAKTAVSPIADSLYPYMVRNKDYKLVKKILVICMPIIVLLCIIVAIYAKPICTFLFGREFAETGTVLKLLLPIAVMILPSYIMGFPVLSPLGLGKYANTSVIIGAVIHAMQLSILYLVGTLDIYSICIATCITEFIILAIRIYIVVKKGRKIEREDVQTA